MSEKGTPSQKHKKNKMNIEKTDRVPDSADIKLAPGIEVIKNRAQSPTTRSSKAKKQMSNALIPASRNDWQVSIEGRRKGPKDNGYIKLAIGTTIGLTVGFLIYTAYKNGIKASK